MDNTMYINIRVSFPENGAKAKNRNVGIIFRNHKKTNLRIDRSTVLAGTQKGLAIWHGNGFV